MIISLFNTLFGDTTMEIIGNIISALATLFFVFSALVKNKKVLLGFQSVSHVVLAISEFIKHAYSSIVQEIISIIRNMTIIFNKNTKALNIIFIVAGVLMGLLLNYLGRTDTDPFFGSLVGLLPIIGNTQYSIVILKSNVKLKSIKLSFAISSSLWGINFMVLGYYLAGILNFVSAISAMIAFIKLIVNKNENEVS